MAPRKQPQPPRQGFAGQNPKQKTEEKIADNPFAEPPESFLHKYKQRKEQHLKGLSEKLNSVDLDLGRVRDQEKALNEARTSIIAAIQVVQEDLQLIAQDEKEAENPTHPEPPTEVVEESSEAE